MLNKLNIFLQEKKISEDKLNELETKIKEYSEMLEDTTDNKLPSIDENAEFEDQVILFFENILIHACPELLFFF